MTIHTFYNIPQDSTNLSRVIESELAFDYLTERDIDIMIPMIDKTFNRELRNISGKMDREAARAIVDLYYRVQEHRIALAGQVRSLAKNSNSVEIPQYFLDQTTNLEKSIIPALEAFSQSYTVGRWASSQHGIGPVLSAGLIAHIDINKAPTAGHIWSYAGLNPNQVWEKGQIRPWNAELKVLCWKIGQSFMKFHNSDNCFYGHLYKKDKLRRIERNENGGNAEFAERLLNEKNYRGGTPTRARLEEGKLPDGQIDAQARRYAVKMFLSHWHEIAYWNEFGKAPAAPYVLEHGGHAHYIAPPFKDEFIPS